MKITSLALLCAVCFLGCGPAPQEQIQLTENSFKNPKFIGEINGRKLYQSQYIFGPHHTQVHYIYFFSNTNLVSVNYSKMQGKTTVNKVIVIDGKEFELKPRN